MQNKVWLRLYHLSTGYSNNGVPEPIPACGSEANVVTSAYEARKFGGFDVYAMLLNGWSHRKNYVGFDVVDWDGTTTIVPYKEFAHETN